MGFDTSLMTKPASGLLSRVTANKHTSAAGIVWLAASALDHMGPIWFPSHTDQFKQTAQQIKELAVGYGLIMSGDAKPKDATNPPLTPGPAADKTNP